MISIISSVFNAYSVEVVVEADDCHDEGKVYMEPWHAASDFGKICDMDDIIRGTLRITPRETGLTHGGIKVILEQYVHFKDPFVFTELGEKEIVLAEPGELINATSFPFEIKLNSRHDRVHWMEGFSGEAFGLRHTLRGTVVRPWYSFDCNAYIPLILYRIPRLGYDMPSVHETQYIYIDLGDGGRARSACLELPSIWVPSTGPIKAKLQLTDLVKPIELVRLMLIKGEFVGHMLAYEEVLLVHTVLGKSTNIVVKKDKGKRRSKNSNKNKSEDKSEFEMDRQIDERIDLDDDSDNSDNDDGSVNDLEREMKHSLSLSHSHDHHDHSHEHGHSHSNLPQSLDKSELEDCIHTHGYISRRDDEDGMAEDEEVPADQPVLSGSNINFEVSLSKSMGKSTIPSNKLSKTQLELLELDPSFDTAEQLRTIDLLGPRDLFHEGVSEDKTIHDSNNDDTLQAAVGVESETLCTSIINEGVPRLDENEQVAVRYFIRIVLQNAFGVSHWNTQEIKLYRASRPEVMVHDRGDGV
jgi:hypothetical protein